MRWCNNLLGSIFGAALVWLISTSFFFFFTSSINILQVTDNDIVNQHTILMVVLTIYNYTSGQGDGKHTLLWRF
jgi:arabinogalactan endo-1,4-beta-galactosidase